MKRGLFAQAIQYGLVKIASMAAPLILAPILTHYLTPSDYGVVVLFDIAFQVTGPLVGFGLQSAIRRRYFDLNRAEFSRYVLSTFLTVTSLLAVFTILVSIVNAFIPSIHGVPSYWAYVLVPWIGSQYVNSVATSFYQLERRPLSHGLLTGGVTLLNLCLSLLLVIQFDLHWQGRIAGQVLAYVLFACASFFIINSRLERPLRISMADSRDALSYGAQLVPYSILERIVALTDRAVIVAYVGLAAAGIYALGSQLAALLVVASDSFSLSWQPWLFERLKRNRIIDRQQVKRALLSVSLLVVLGAIILIWLGPPIFSLVIDSRYNEAYTVLPILVVALMFRSISRILSAIVMFEGSMRPLSGVAVLGAIVNLTGNLILVPRHGWKGAATATCIAFASTLLMTCFAVYRSWQKLPRPT
ncbi:MAG: polysaccharide biosynthesis C-terminal domain-containing protein [Myxococcales bacterium]|nr:MAG: polysaccharide biosynthesis C-terminal domain-containing protein [Myxococcales bacterium]